MPFVHWSGGILARVHIASNRVKTLCGRPIPGNAAETAKAPQDKAKICKACQKIEQEEKRFQRFLK
jgi:hypothetical protein